MKHNLLKKIYLFLLMSMVLVIGVDAQEFINGVQKGKIRVKMQPSALRSLKLKSTRNGIETGVVAFDEVSSRVSANKMKRIIPYSAKFEDKYKKYGLDLWYEIDYSTNYDAKEVVKEYTKLDEVATAEVIREITIENARPTQVFSAAELAATSFDDPRLDDQWHYHNDGTLFEDAVAGADINLFEAWDKQTGSSDVIVAIIDGGIDVDHEDLKDAIWVNDLELNGEPGVDDDGNGYVDDIHGYNFALDKSELLASYHGTHVAGTVGAINGNGIGVSGVAGGDGINPGVRLMSCQMLTDEDVSGGMAEALIYAANNGAVIAQCSWGYTTVDTYDELVLDAIDYFVAEAGSYSGSPMQGGVAIFAAGNESIEGNIYPGCYEPVVAVGAIDYTNGKASYSNYGEWVDVSAPGGSTGNDEKGGILSTSTDNSYAYLNGTSMACPHVSGIAALVVSEYGGSDFTSDKLKRHLVTSVRDLSPYLLDSEIGKMGAGFIDAAMALQSGSTANPPSVVTDLLIQTSQDEAKVEWSIVADADDEIGSSYTLYWSKSSFDNSSLGAAASTIIEHQFASVGDKVSYTIEDLDSNTDYYFAIKAYDRWGNGSALSTVQKVATNNGPAIQIDMASSEVSIDVTQNAQSNTIVNLSNNDDGLLQWSSYIGLVDKDLDDFSVSQFSPVYSSGYTISSLGSSEVLQYPTVSAPVSMSIDDRLTYNSAAASVYIGEEDTELTNTAATRYYVENSFNATNMWVSLDLDPQYGPATIEFYKGGHIQDAQLITSQELTSEYDGAISYYVDLEEQLYLEAGNYYWVVVHVPAGNLFPLGVTKETDETDSDNCLYSSNGGQSWEFLNDVYGTTDDYIWKVTLRSLTEHLGDYISISPSEGELSGNSSTELVLSVDGSELIDGTYNEHLIFASNDSKNKLIKKPVTLIVDGHQAVLTSTSIVDYEQVFIGTSKTFDIEIVNEGYTGYPLGTGEISISNPEFEVKSVSDEIIAARSSATIRISYIPTTVGAQSAQVTLDNGRGSYSFKIAGTGIEPAQIELAPSTKSIGTGLTIGDPVDAMTFDITNVGNYPLSYVFPSLVSDYEIDGLERPVNDFGYTYNYALDLGPDYTQETPKAHGWKDISSSTNIFNTLKGIDYAIQLDLGFSFPYYDRFYDKVWVNEQGVLVFGEDGNIRLNPNNNTKLSQLRELDMISACMLSANYSVGNGAVYYERTEGEFRVHYENVTIGNRSVNLQIVLHATGDFDILFYSLEKVKDELPNYFVGITDMVNQDHTYASNSEYPLQYAVNTDYNSFFHFHHPGEDMIVEASNAEGTLLPNETATVTLEFNTSSAIQGDAFQRLSILSNDVVNPLTYFEVTGNFTSGGIAEISLASDTIVYGDVYKTSVQERLLQVVNKGTGSDYITGIDFSDSRFSASLSLPYEVKPRQSIYLPIAVNTDNAATIEGSATIHFESGETLTVYLEANVIENAIIEVTPSTEIQKTIDAGTYTDIDFTFSNTGLGDLEFLITPNQWCYPLLDQSVETSIEDFDYSLSEGDGSGWVDILDIAAETNLYSAFWSSASVSSYAAVELEKSVHYYGQEYSTVYISPNGFVTFIEPTEMSNNFEFPYGFPAEDKFQGVIGVLTGLHTNISKTVVADAGIYYHEFDDKFVVTFHAFIDLAGGLSRPYDFQLVLHQNGTIDFNYSNFDFVKYSGLIGIESPDEKDGMLVYNDLFLGAYDDFSYHFLPIRKEVVEPQGEKTVTMRLDASALNDGVYSHSIEINNNSVENPVVEVPVTLTVVGEPDVVATNISETVWYVQDSVYVQGFKIKNQGSKAINLASSTTTGDSDIKVEFYYPAAGNLISGYSEGYVALDNFIGQQIYSSTFQGQILVEDGSILEPGQSWQCYVTYSPSAVGSSSISSTIKDIDGNTVLVWTGDISSKLPPVAGLGDDIYVLADNKEHTEVRQLLISNTAGSSELEWSASLNFSRGQKAPEEAYVTPTSTEINNNALMAAGDDVTLNQNASLKSTEDYNRTLQHTDKTSADNWLGFGYETAFVAATKFTVPDNGFLLSHIETWYRYENVLNSTLYVEILAGGSSINNATVIAKGSLQYEEPSYNDVGKFFTIPLDQPAYLYPGEDFYVVIKYPLGVGNPQGRITDLANATDGRYYYLYEDTWVDIYETTSFYDNAYLVRAYEEVYEQKTWLTLTQGEGTIDAGASFNLDINFDAQYAQEYVNKAELVLTSNDPVNKELSVDLYLLMNNGPEFTYVEGPSNMDENTSGVVKLTVKDIENDTYTVELASDFNWVEMTKNEGGEVELTLTPDYFAAGVHEINLIGTDEHGEETSFIYDIEVNNVNRKPIYTNGELADTTMVLEHGGHEVSFNEWIIDQDRDDLSVVINMDKEGIVSLYEGESGVVITPQTIGEVTMTISATDAHGSKLTGSFVINVIHRTGLDEIQNGGLEVYPNPATDFVYVKWNNNLKDMATVRLLSVDGSVVQVKTFNTSSVNEYKFNVSDLARGIYIVEIVSGEETYKEKIIIK